MKERTQKVLLNPQHNRGRPQVLCRSTQKLCRIVVQGLKFQFLHSFSTVLICFDFLIRNFSIRLVWYTDCTQLQLSTSAKIDRKNRKFNFNCIKSQLISLKLAKMVQLTSVLSKFYDEYQNNTPKKLKIIDAYLVYILLTGIMQFAYCVLVGTFPFNSFLSGFISSVSCFVLAGEKHEI